MFIRVKADGEFSGDNAFLVNHNCGIRLIAEYLKMKTFLAPQFELDLCHQCGYLVGMYSLNPTTNGINIFKNRTLYYMIRYQRTGRNDISNVPIPCVGKNQKLSIQILNQIKRNNGECHCLGEPSLLEFSLIGTEASIIERAKHSRLEKQYTKEFFNKQTFSDANIEEKPTEEITSRRLKSASLIPKIRQSLIFSDFDPRVITDAKSLTA